MSFDTNLNVSPYFDDFDANNQFYHVAYKPSVSIQARELNQMQSILRHQIEKFGDSIFQIGTIIEGCNFVFYPVYPYVKIKDLTVDGQNVTLANYKGLFIKNSANLQAIVVDTTVGFETTPPDLNTLYVSYRNSGNDGNTFQYSLGDVLTIFDSNTGIWAVTVNTAGQAFSNSDSMVFTSAVAVNVTSGSFSNGEYVTQPSTGANLQIVGVNNSFLASAGQVVLSLKPRTADLALVSANGSQWAVANGDTIRNSGNTAVGDVMAVIGSGAEAAVVTDGSGRVVQVAMQQRGHNYSFLPTVTIKSQNNSSGIAALSLVPQNYVTQVTIANTVGSVGNGYAFGVSDGTIYQKGLFLKVDAQTIVVEKYDTSPNNVSVGFSSLEQVINSNIDTNLLDNASGFKNYQAPGADRIKIVPILALQDTSTLDTTSFLPIVSWSEGYPYRQNQSTSYSAIGDKMAQELYETEGDFVLNRFEVTSRSPFTRDYEGTKISVITNPGSAYIKGQRVFNFTNYSVDIDKAIDTAQSNNRYITLNYGNWIRIKEVGGVFQFSTGDTITLYDTAKSFISGGSVLSGNIAAVGNAIGTARIRSLVHEFGIPGDANCTYKLYLFDIDLSQGVNFSDIRSIRYGGTYPGIADVVLTNTAQGNVATLANNLNDYLLFDSGAAATLKNATNVVYTYRTIDQTTTFANTGILSKSISSTPSETFPYTGPLTTSQLQDLYVVPVGNNLIASANAAGSANASNSSSSITGNSTTWLNDFAAGDYIQLFQNTTVNNVRRVVSVANNIAMTLDANVSFTGSNLGVYRYFPKNAPIPFGLRTGLSANVSGDSQTLTLNLGTALQGSVTVNTAVGVNITRTNVLPATKTAARDQMVKICTSNNVGGTSGPWCVGISDIFRLKKVYMASDSTVNTASNDVTSYFYIDHKQNEDYLDIGYLYLRPNGGLTIANGNYLLVQFDCFQSSGVGYFTTVSYTGANSQTIAIKDSTPLINLGSSVSTWEVPECYGSRGQYFDLLKYFDFRPIAANSATATTNAASAPLNPTYTLSFGNTADPTNDQKFPLPDSALYYNMEQYMYRIDSLFCGKDGRIYAVRGQPSLSLEQIKKPSSTSDSIRLVDIYLPPYPNLPSTVSQMQSEVLTKWIGNINLSMRRQTRQTISIPSQAGTAYDTQPRAYSMAAIGELERRIQALEYYNSLNALQTDMINRVVPSSSDGSVNRFKFGIFVDDFSTAISQNITNPSYSATIAASNLTPPTVEWIVGYGSARSAAVPYIDWPLLEQPHATVPISIQPEVVTSMVMMWDIRTDHLAPSQSGQVVLVDYAYPQFANVSGPATLYFHMPALTINFILDPNNFAIYQGSTRILDAYNNAEALTSSDIAFLKAANNVPGDFFASTPFTTLTRPAVGWVAGSGKIRWTHNPSGGTNYTIVSQRQSKFDHWQWGLFYPAAQGQQITVPPSSTATSYSGIIDVEPTTLLLGLTPPPNNPTQNMWTSSFTAQGELDVATDYTTMANILVNVKAYQGASLVTPAISTTFLPQSFGITIYGLRPLTAHNFTISGINKNSRTLQYGYKNYGDAGPLMSDQYGTIRFNYYFYPDGEDQDIRNIFLPGWIPSQGQNWGTQAAASLSQPISAGSLAMVISSGDGTSRASFNMAVVADAELVLSTVTTGSAPSNPYSFLPGTKFSRRF